MQKLFLTAATTLSVAILLLATTAAQQTTASTPKPATAAKSTTTAKSHSPAPAAKSPQVLTLKTQKDKISYAIGMNIGQSMKKDSLDLDPAIVSRGLNDALTGAKPLMTEDEAKSVMTEFRSEMMKKKQSAAQQSD